MGIGEAAFRALADTTEDCVFLADRRGRYLAVNRGFARWVGRPEEEILGRAASDLWPSLFSENEAPGHRLALSGERVEREERRPRGNEMRTVPHPCARRCATITASFAASSASSAT